MTREPMTVIIGIDMETDVGSFSPYYEGLRHGTPLLLDLFDELGLPATFLFTGEAALVHPEIARLCIDRGHEVGCHSYQHETVGDPLFDLPGTKPILPEEVYPRIALNTQIVEEATGVRPVSFRCPRLWGSTEVVQALNRLGYTTDLTYPMYFYRERFEPYFVDLEQWTQVGDSNLLEVPNFADMAMESNDPGLERDRDQWPLFRTEGADSMLERVHAFDAFCRARGEDTYLCFYIHPWEFWEIDTEFDFGEATIRPHEFITKNCGATALEEFKKLLVGLQVAGAKFYQAKELPDVVRERKRVQSHAGTV